MDQMRRCQAVRKPDITDDKEQQTEGPEGVNEVKHLLTLTQFFLLCRRVSDRLKPNSDATFLQVCLFSSWDEKHNVYKDKEGTSYRQKWEFILSWEIVSKNIFNKTKIGWIFHEVFSFKSAVGTSYEHRFQSPFLKIFLEKPKKSSTK